MKLYIRFFVFLIVIGNDLNAQVTGLSGWNIFLDPGHSQKENMGIYGYSEAERNVRVALRLSEMLLNTTDIDTVYLSRIDDFQQVSLSQRTDKANTLGADWFHSIHSDAGSPGSNSTLLLWGQYYNGNEKVPNGGQAMADIMVDLLTQGMRTNTRGSIGDCSFYTWSDWCKTSGGPYLHVNRVSLMPSELSESGFHTNPKQNQLFMNEDWKKLEARTFYWSILEFFEIGRPFVGICTGVISDIENGIPINGAKVYVNNQTYTTDTYESLFYKYSNDPEGLHNGFYYFENLPDDTLEMIIEHEKYYSDTLNVVIQDNFFTFQDVNLINKIPPVILSSTPENGEERFPAWNDIIFNFSRKMNRVSVETTFVSIPELKGKFLWYNNYSKLVIQPDSLDFNTDYQLVISGDAKDIFNHLLDGNGDGIGGDDYILNFRSGPEDLIAPKLTSAYPLNNAINVELWPILNFAFDEPIDITSILENSIQLSDYGGPNEISGQIIHYLVKNQSILSFFPGIQLSPKQNYLSRLNPGLKDVHGNEFTQLRYFRFTTKDTWDDVIQIDNFDKGISNWLVPQQSGSTTGIQTDSTSRVENSDFVNLLTNSATSMQLNYGWDDNENSWLIREYLAGGSPRDIMFDGNYIMQIYVFGDSSGVKFRFAVDDNFPIESSENHEVSPWFTINWLGWRLVEWDMANDGTGAWSTLGNGNLDGTLRFDSIQLTHSPGNPLFGTLYFDDLRLVTKVQVGIEDKKMKLPTEFALFQNYPNPFNPTTTITFALPNQSLVELQLYDIKGNLVKTLVHRELSPGIHSVELNAEDLASGTYLYRLQAEGFDESKKLILLR